MNSSIALLSSNVFYHKFQTIVPNKYEQGNPYVTSKFKNTTNDYLKFTVKKTKTTNINNKTSHTFPSKSSSFDRIVQRKSMFEKIAFAYEGGAILDFDKYKTVFYNSVSDAVYKSISKRHQLLKKDLYAFINETEFVIPKNKDVLSLFSNVLSTNLMICINKKIYMKFENPKWSSTVVVFTDAPTDSDCVHYRNILEATLKLGEAGMHEYKEYKDMKIAELKEYADNLGIVDVKNKKKNELIEAIHAIYKN